MFGLVLSFVVCMGGTPDNGRCLPVEIPFEGSMQQCMIYGQTEVVRWISDHGDYALRRGYRCLPGRGA